MILLVAFLAACTQITHLHEWRLIASGNTAVALVVQLLCFAAMRLPRRDARAALAQGDMAEGVFLGSTSLVLGILSAACLS